ncbi:hypothetical protein [Kineococcus sp. SYSU DK005]|uniref:hypothetical protein n=1 Tax=Kineococcus sp. SYSU DK005 TaxID=3383126 RepID=UPI003D7EF5CD
MTERFSGRRAITIATASFATLTLVPWAVDATGTPRAGSVLAALPLALLFGALAGYAASPEDPREVSTHRPHRRRRACGNRQPVRHSAPSAPSAPNRPGTRSGHGPTRQP